MKSAKFEKYYQNKMTWEEYQVRASKIANNVMFSRIYKVVQKFNEQEMYLFYQILEAYQNTDHDLTIQGIIACELAPTSEESFCRYADKNSITPSIAKNYFTTDKDKSWSLDVQSSYLSETYSKDISIDSLIDFIVSHPKGKHTYIAPYLSKKAELIDDLRALSGIKELPDKFLNMYLQNFQAPQEDEDDFAYKADFLEEAPF